MWVSFARVISKIFEKMDEDDFEILKDKRRGDVVRDGRESCAKRDGC
jgi:hypothetical protein